MSNSFQLGESIMTVNQAHLNDVLIVFTGVLLLFRRVAQMERHHTLRVFLIAAVLSCTLIYFLDVLASEVIPRFDDCVQFDKHYSHSEV